MTDVPDRMTDEIVLGTVYGALSGDYDNVPPPPPKEPNVSVELRRLKQRDRIWNRMQKWCVLPTKGVWSIYADTSFHIVKPVAKLAEKRLANHSIALLRHPNRNCAYEEIDVCVKLKKITAKQGERARAALQLYGHPKDYGLWACGVIFRRTDCPFSRLACHLMRDLIEGCPRDQIWFPHILRTLDAEHRLNTIDGDIFHDDTFVFKGHRK